MMRHVPPHATPHGGGRPGGLARSRRQATGDCAQAGVAQAQVASAQVAGMGSRRRRRSKQQAGGGSRLQVAQVVYSIRVCSVVCRKSAYAYV
eukprot:scaffold3189_cov138-Isochrysis_galbana.AAC.6